MRGAATISIALALVLAACGSSSTTADPTGLSADPSLGAAVPDDNAFTPTDSTTAVLDATADTSATAATTPTTADATPVPASTTTAPVDSAAVTTPTSVATTAATFDLPGCPDAPRAAVSDKAQQRYWLCADGAAITDEIPMTTASGNYGLPPIGTYEVFARDENAFGINGEPLERFVAFYTTPRGNRIAFHEVVNQDPETVGDLDQRGASAGCFRVREADSIQVWNYLQIGDPVVVISN